MDSGGTCGGGGGSSSISQGDSSVEVIDAGTGQVDVDIDGNLAVRFLAEASATNTLEFTAAASGNDAVLSLETTGTQGDFLIRNVVGIDDESGAIAIGDYVRPGQTVQFHVRDHASATADLEQLVDARGMRQPGGALLFSCNGRGQNMFPAPHHDADMISGKLNGVPVAGFFAAGEIGPVAGKNFLHGFTASVVLLS